LIVNPPRLAAHIRSKSQDSSDSEKSYEDDSQREHSHNTLRQLGIFITKMMVYELQRKAPRFDMLFCLENEQFQGQIIDLIIRNYDKNPKIEAQNAYTLITNLVALFRHVKRLNVIPRVYVAMLDLIAKLTVHNTSEIRLIMHKEKLFELRFEIICFLLQSYNTKPEAMEHFIRNFEFQSIAAHPDFRESYGLHFLIRIFLESYEKDYQNKVYHILKDIFGGMEENKIFLKEFFDDDQVFDYFFEKSFSTFVRWYFLPNAQGEPLRLEMQQKVQKILVPLDHKLVLSLEKLSVEQKAKQKSNKQTKTSNKWNQAASMEQKRTRDEKNSRVVIIEFMKKIEEESNLVQKQGTEAWEKCKNKI